MELRRGWLMHLKPIVTGTMSSSLTAFALANSTVGVALIVAVFLITVLIICTISSFEIEHDGPDGKRVRRFNIVLRALRRRRRGRDE